MHLLYRGNMRGSWRPLFPSHRFSGVVRRFATLLGEERQAGTGPLSLPSPNTQEMGMEGTIAVGMAPTAPCLH